VSWGRKKEAGLHSEGIRDKQRERDADDRDAVEAAWFWSKRWQKMEREVGEHVERGEVTIFDDMDSFLAILDAYVHSADPTRGKPLKKSLAAQRKTGANDGGGR
jgi:hypothetical protein